MRKYAVYSDFKNFDGTKLPLYPFLLPLINTLLAYGFDKTKPSEGIHETKVEIPGYLNNTAFESHSSGAE